MSELQQTEERQGKRLHQKIRLGDMLVQNRVISESQLIQALTEQKKSGHKLGQTLIELGFVDELQLLNFLSQQLQIPLIDLRTFRLQAEVVKTLPETLARRYRVIVLEQGKHDALVGMADPSDLFAYDELSRKLNKRIRQAVVSEGDLLDALDRMYRKSQELDALAGELDEDLGQTPDLDLNALMRNAEAGDAPVIRLLQTLFEDALMAKASDIHIEPDEKVIRVRQRVDGTLHEHIVNERRIAPALVQRLKLLANLNISERRLPQDGRFQIRVKNHSIDVRLSTMPVQHGEAVVMRLLDQSSGRLSLDDLGFEPRLLQRLRTLIQRPHGMILVTGPTGSGKTTTLYAALNELNTPERKIITVEDPVEYTLPRINQVQVNVKIDLTFARVLRTALRQDPDVLLIGEMRDLETAQIGLRAAITGHFVLSTLHTNSAIGTVSRLLDMGAPGYLMASSLMAIVAQRLIRRICPDCAAPHQPDEQQQIWLQSLGLNAEQFPGISQGRGCNRCGHTGYQGRIGVYEMLEMNPQMASALRSGDLDQFTRLARENKGFETLTQAALRYASEGKTSLDEVIRISGDMDAVVVSGHDG